MVDYKNETIIFLNFENLKDALSKNGWESLI